MFCWFLFTTMAAEKAPETFIRTQSEPKELVAGQKILISIYLYTTQDVERVRQAGPELTLKGYNIERLTGGKVYYINRNYIMFSFWINTPFFQKNQTRCSFLQ